MMDLSEEDKYLLSQGIDPFGEGITPAADDELLKAMAAREQLKKQQYPVGSDIYYEMRAPRNTQPADDALLMEMLYEE
jgi:hypothetical protein